MILSQAIWYGGAAFVLLAVWAFSQNRPRPA